MLRKAYMQAQKMEEKGPVHTQTSKIVSQCTMLFIFQKNHVTGRCAELHAKPHMALAPGVMGKKNFFGGMEECRGLRGLRYTKNICMEKCHVVNVVDGTPPRIFFAGFLLSFWRHPNLIPYTNSLPLKIFFIFYFFYFPSRETGMGWMRDERDCLKGWDGQLCLTYMSFLQLNLCFLWNKTSQKVHKYTNKAWLFNFQDSCQSKNQTITTK